MASTQIKFFTSLLLSTLYFGNAVAQKLNEVYFIEAKSPYSDPSIALPPDESNVVLPIALSTFEATPRNSENIINWTTLSEQNVKEFIIERSINPSNNWGILATFIADQSYPEGTNRTFIDSNPNCISYYRLRSVDFDGKETLSKTISVQRNCLKSTFINTYPNPTQASLNINFDAPQSGILTLSFTDMLGRVILEKKSDATEGINNISLDLSGLRNGLYIITFTDSNNNMTSQRIEKN